MVTYYNRLACLTALFLFCLGTVRVMADPVQAVIIERQGDRAVINKGLEEGVKVGQTWNLGEARFVVESLREHSASGRLEGDAGVGAIASLGKDAPRVAANPKATKKVTRQTPAPREKSAEELKRAADRSLDAVRKKYRNALGRRTESRGFVTQAGGAGIAGVNTQTVLNTGLEAYSLYQLYDVSNAIGLDPTGSFISNPLMIATSAAGMFERNRLMNQTLETVRIRVDVEATLWDETLIDLQTEVAAAEQGWSVQDTLNKKVQNIVEKGVDKYVVLEVRIKNVGQNPAPLEPFKYRVFMMSAEDQPIAASRIDPVLDKTLQPGEEIRGMVYFPKIVAAGQSKLRIAFEQMFGDRGTLTFNTN